MRGGWIAATVAHPVTTAMATLAVLVFGLVALLRLPVALLPDLSYPSLTVQTVYADAAPTEVEELVTRPIEELVGAVPGLVQVESVSREGRSEVVLDFAWGTSVDRAMNDVREKLDRVVLPQGTERPVVLRYDPSQEPIMRLALVAAPGRPADLAAMRLRADRAVKRSLEKISGVAAAQIHGGDEEEVRVEIDPARLGALGLGADAVVTALRTDNINQPGGALSEQRSRYLIRTIHEARRPSELGATILRSEAGAELRLRDVAAIGRVPKEREELAFVGAREAVELAVYREGDANTVAVAAAVINALDRLPLVDGEQVVVLSSQADFIASAIDEVRKNTLLGGLLAVFVLLFFLRDLRATLVIAATIPISLLATFVPLQALGVSLNLMSLGGLALGVGMLVDNGIVVLEAIARVREREPERSPARAAILGTAEVAPSVIAATLTTVAVFLPIAFVEGIAGQLVRDLSFAVSLSITASMLVSLTLVPVLQSLGGAPTTSTEPPPRSLLAWLVVPFALLFRLLRLLTRATSPRCSACSRARSPPSTTPSPAPIRSPFASPYAPAASCSAPRSPSAWSPTVRPKASAARSYPRSSKARSLCRSRCPRAPRSSAPPSSPAASSPRSTATPRSRASSRGWAASPPPARPRARSPAPTSPRSTSACAPTSTPAPRPSSSPASRGAFMTPPTIRTPPYSSAAPRSSRSTRRSRSGSSPRIPPAQPPTPAASYPSCPRSPASPTSPPTTSAAAPRCAYASTASA
jgi:hypothetical protein